MYNKTNVRKVRDAGLCMGCGTCSSICPAEAIRIVRHAKRGIYLPVIDVNLCNECGLCLKICPGKSVDIEQLADVFLNGQNKDKLIGKFSECYIGHSTDKDIRYNSSSGGLVTSLLIYALENKEIDGALVLGMSDTNPLETKPYIATTRKEIISASGSKYCPSATNIGLREILKSDGKFAVVGLPCHIHAIRKWELINKKLREKIVLHLGIFCANNNTYLGTEYFLRNNGINPDDVSMIRYRGEGWPGKISVTLKDNTKMIIPRATSEKKWHRRALFSSAFHYSFVIPRCLLCADQTCELADISFGDPWLKEYRQTDNIGKSLLIVRSHYGDEILKEALELGAIELEKVPVNLVRKAQNYRFRDRCITVMIRIFTS